MVICNAVICATYDKHASARSGVASAGNHPHTEPLSFCSQPLVFCLHLSIRISCLNSRTIYLDPPTSQTSSMSKGILLAVKLTTRRDWEKQGQGLSKQMCKPAKLWISPQSSSSRISRVEALSNKMFAVNIVVPFPPTHTFAPTRQNR